MKNNDFNQYLQDELKQNRTLRKDFDLISHEIDIAIQIYRLRKSRNMTQEQLATKLGVKQSNIARWESPGYSSYTVSNLGKLASALKAKFNFSLTPQEALKPKPNFLTNAVNALGKTWQNLDMQNVIGKSLTSASSHTVDEVTNGAYNV